MASGIRAAAGDSLNGATGDPLRVGFDAHPQCASAIRLMKLKWAVTQPIQTSFRSALRMAPAAFVAEASMHAKA